jgi:hypothetical protein
MLDTLANVKSRLGITGTDYDTFLTNQITLVSDVIEAYCRRSFVSTDWEETFYYGDYPLNSQLSLFHYPVLATGFSIVEDGITLDPTSYRLHKGTGTVTRTDCSYFYGADVTVVSYTAGFATVPSPVLGVLDSIVEERYNKETSGVGLNFGSDVQRISIPGSISIDFDYTLTNNDRKSPFGTILGNNMNILDFYRSERAVLHADRLKYVEEP